MRESDYADAYKTFSRTLRAWLVAYGIGAPVLLVSQESVAVKLAGFDETRTIVWIFLVGVGIQILSTFLYKITLGYLFLNQRDELPSQTLMFRISRWIFRQLWHTMSFQRCRGRHGE